MNRRATGVGTFQVCVPTHVALRMFIMQVLASQLHYSFTSTPHQLIYMLDELYEIIWYLLLVVKRQESKFSINLFVQSCNLHFFPESYK